LKIVNKTKGVFAMKNYWKIESLSTRQEMELAEICRKSLWEQVPLYQAKYGLTFQEAIATVYYDFIIDNANNSMKAA